MLEKKEIWVIFLFKFKMGPKEVETTWNINNTFGPGTANKGTVQWWFKKFCKVDESLEYEENSSWPSKVDNNQLRVIIKADPLTVTWEVANELNIKHSMVICHLSKLERWKISIRECLMSWSKKEKNKQTLFWCVFSFSTWQQWTIYQSCYEKWTADNWWWPA